MVARLRRIDERGNPNRHIGVISSLSREEESMMLRNEKATRAAAYPVDVPVARWLGLLALTLALLAIPAVGHAQGLVGGMERGAAQGSYDGGRAAGPVGAAVGGAVGAGVGGAFGVVDGALGIRPYRHC